MSPKERTSHTSQLSLALLLLAAGAPGEVHFKHHFIDPAGPVGECWGTNVLADLDNDGRLDVIVGKSQWGKGKKATYWYRNLGRIDRWGPRGVLQDRAACDCGGTALDVDRDGWTDFLSGRWYRNPGSPTAGKPFEPMWSFHGGHDVETADLDGDGREEMIVHTQSGPAGVHVYKAGPDPAKPWRRICALAVRGEGGQGRSNVHAAVSPGGIGDLDGDGDRDIAFVGSWLENADGKGERWTKHKGLGFDRIGKWGKAVRCCLADIDGDGRMDIVQSECDMPTARVVWFRNVHGDGSKWQRNLLPDDRTPGDFHSLAVADFDLDGDPDVYVDEMEHLHVPKGREGRIGMIVWENLDGKGGRWAKRMIVTGLGGHQAQAADLDGDGDVDIVTRPYTAHHNANGGRMHVSVLENLARRPDAMGKGSGLGPDSAAAPPKPAPRPVPTPAPKPVRSADLQAGLLARWTFDEPGESTGEFDGADDYVDAGALDVPGEAMTLAARFRARRFDHTPGRDGRIVSKATGTAEQDHYWMLSTWRVGRAVRLRFRLKAGGSTATLIASSGDLEPGAAVHVAAVYDGKTMRLYKDGRLVGSRAKTGRIDTAAAVRAWIGGNPPRAADRPFAGRIDDVRIYRRALTEQEVRALAAAEAKARE